MNELTSLKEQIADKIRANFVELFPETSIKVMVDYQLNEFAEIKSVKSLFNPQEKVTPFELIIQELILEAGTKAALQEINKQQYTEHFDNLGNKVAGSAVESAIELAIPILIKSLVGVSTQTALNEIRQAMMSNRW